MGYRGGRAAPQGCPGKTNHEEVPQLVCLGHCIWVSLLSEQQQTEWARALQDLKDGNIDSALEHMSAIKDCQLSLPEKHEVGGLDQQSNRLYPLKAQSRVPGCDHDFYWCEVHTAERS